MKRLRLNICLQCNAFQAGDDEDITQKVGLNVKHGDVAHHGALGARRPHVAHHYHDEGAAAGAFKVDVFKCIDQLADNTYDAALRTQSHIKKIDKVVARGSLDDGGQHYHGDGDHEFRVMHIQAPHIDPDNPQLAGTY